MYCLYEFHQAGPDCSMTFKFSPVNGAKYKSSVKLQLSQHCLYPPAWEAVFRTTSTQVEDEVTSSVANILAVQSSTLQEMMCKLNSE